MSEILFLAHRVPYPPNRGDKIRSWNVLKALAKIAPVHVAVPSDAVDDPDCGRSEVEAIAASYHVDLHLSSKAVAVGRALVTGRSASVSAFSSASLQSYIDGLIEKRPISAVYAFSGQMGQFVAASRGALRFVMDFVDMDSAKFAQWGRERGGLSGFANDQEAKRLFAFEKQVAQHADLSLFVSEAEADLFRGATGLGPDRVVALKNGVDLAHYAPGHSKMAERPNDRPLAVFTGQMDYAPNVEAVEWFAKRVLPLAPELHFAIVGRAPTDRVRALGALPNVTVTGAVDDTRDWMSAADVVVAPLQLARGIQNKVLEAMAMGKAVIASPAAAEGIDALGGRDLIVAETPEAQALAIKDILTDSAKRTALGRAARTHMESRYSWDATLADLPKLIGFAA